MTREKRLDPDHVVPLDGADAADAPLKAVSARTGFGPRKGGPADGGRDRPLPIGVPAGVRREPVEALCGLCDNCLAGVVTDVEDDGLTVRFGAAGYRTLSLRVVGEEGLLAPAG